MLEGLVERCLPVPRVARRLAGEGPFATEDAVRDIARKMDRSEYKRRQAAPGLKVSTKAFGSGRRIPIAQRAPT